MCMHPFLDMPSLCNSNFFVLIISINVPLVLCLLHLNEKNMTSKMSAV